MALTKDRITAAEAGSLAGLLHERVRRTPDAPALRQFDRRTQLWCGVTWRELEARVARWQEALAREQLPVGARVAVSLRNSIEWIAFDQAALALGLVVVPLYTDDRPDNVAFILNDCGASLLLTQDGLRWRRLAEACNHIDSLRRVVVMDAEPDETFDDPRVRPAAAWLPQGEFAWRCVEIDPDALATIVYTSGTTGHPKGVMLSHRNILSVVEVSLQVVNVYREDIFLSFLPLSHMFERAVGYYLPIAAGATVAYARSIANLADDLGQVQPTVLIAVPRIFERVYARIMNQLEGAPRLRRALFDFAVHVGWRRFEHQQRRARWSPLSLFWPLLDPLVGKRVRARLGGRLRLVVSGGAALQPAIAQLFIGLGLPVLQGYGLTETSPQVSCNHLDFNDPASVGPALPGIEIRIGDNEELLVRSPGNMLGYWNNPQATATMLSGGWLHTGDQAAIRGGRIYITGRIKDVLVLSNGEKVPPAEMEQAIALDPLMDQVLIAGEGRAFLCAIVVLNPDQWQTLAALLHVDPVAGLNDRHVHHEVLGRIGRQLHDFPTWAKVRRVHLTLEPWTVENGMLTPTLKTKRAALLAHYADVIEHIYNSGHHFE